MVRLGVLVSGNGSNLQALIDAIADGTIPGEISVVISNEPGVRALERAALAGIETVCIPHREFATRKAFDAQLVTELRQRSVDWVVFAGFMRLVTPVLLDAYPLHVVNLHPSLLPAFPGVEAGRQAFEHGVKVTGCTVHLVTPDMDAGPILAQTPVDVRDSDDLEALMARIHTAEHHTLVEVVRAMCQGRVELDDSEAARGPRARVRPE